MKEGKKPNNDQQDGILVVYGKSTKAVNELIFYVGTFSTSKKKIILQLK